MESLDTLVVTFEDIPVADAGKNVAALREQLLDDCPGITANVRKDDPTTQDFGATLVFVLGAPAIVALAKGISNYLSRRPNGILVVKKNGDVIFRGDSADAAVIAKALAPKKKK
jgi:hypothetical protein